MRRRPRANHTVADGTSNSWQPAFTIGDSAGDAHDTALIPAILFTPPENLLSNSESADSAHPGFSAESVPNCESAVRTMWRFGSMRNPGFRMINRSGTCRKRGQLRERIADSGQGEAGVMKTEGLGRTNSSTSSRSPRPRDVRSSEVNGIVAGERVRVRVRGPGNTAFSPSP
jgi:hypothetical protein